MNRPRTDERRLAALQSIGLLLAVSLATSGCARRLESSGDMAAAGTLPPVDSAAFHIDQAMAVSLEVRPVTLHDEPRALRTTGKVQFDESRLSRVLAPVAGQVSGLHVNVGDRVQEGEPMFYLRSRDVAAAMEDAMSALHDLDLAEKTLAMTQDLYDHQAASRIALQQAEADVAKGHLRVYRTEASLGAIGISAPYDLSRLDPRVPVTSPLTGAVIDRHLTEGQYVQPDSTPLLTIADLSTVWVEAEAFEREVRFLRVGESADVTTTAYPDEQFHARVAHVGDVLDPSTRTVKVRFQVANPELKLKPEMFATVLFRLDEAEQAITVPASAVLTEGDKSFVYVAIDDHTFARRAVEVSADARGSCRILRGLKEGDRIVTAGAVLLRGQETHGTS
jgi:cobalt-zinc-cadmium efflux system membrane fusion protein